MTTNEQIDIVCAKCGSPDVTRDATAAWDADAQDWSLCGVQDQGYCDDCGGEADLKEIPRLDWRRKLEAVASACAGIAFNKTHNEWRPFTVEGDSFFWWEDAEGIGYHHTDNRPMTFEEAVDALYSNLIK